MIGSLSHALTVSLQAIETGFWSIPRNHEFERGEPRSIPPRVDKGALMSITDLGFRPRGMVPVWLAALLISSGCDDGTPSVSSSREQATVKGSVTVLGKRPRSGKVVFDPSNVRRKDTVSVSADIAEDGTYAISTLVGENRINVVTPEAKKDPKLQFLTVDYEVQRGENAYDIVIPPPAR